MLFSTHLALSHVPATFADSHVLQPLGCLEIENPGFGELSWMMLHFD